MTISIAVKNLNAHFSGEMCCQKDWRFIRAYIKEARPTVRRRTARTTGKAVPLQHCEPTWGE
jgi:hypothetical protein